MKRPTNYATIRLDESLRDRIKTLAAVEHRSFMAEVIVLLEEALTRRNKRNGRISNDSSASLKTPTPEATEIL
jgi:hypothetical protein